MKTSLNIPALTMILSATTSLAMAAPSPVKPFGEAAPATASQRVIPINDNTKYVNVTAGETVTFVIDGKSITWNFDTLPDGVSLLLNSIIPDGGAAARGVKVYVAPNPLYSGPC